MEVNGTIPWKELAPIEGKKLKKKNGTEKPHRCSYQLVEVGTDRFGEPLPLTCCPTNNIFEVASCIITVYKKEKKKEKKLLFTSALVYISYSILPCLHCSARNVTKQERTFHDFSNWAAFIHAATVYFKVSEVAFRRIVVTRCHGDHTFLIN